MWRTGYVVMVAKHGFTRSVLELHKNHNYFYVMDVNSYVMYKFLYFNMFVLFSFLHSCIEKNKYIHVYIWGGGGGGGGSRGFVGDWPKSLAPGVGLLQSHNGKSPPFPRRGGVGLCIDR